MEKFTIDQQILKCAMFINIMQKITENTKKEYRDKY